MYFPVSNHFYIYRSIVLKYVQHRIYTKSIFKMHIPSQEYEYIYYIHNCTSRIANPSPQVIVHCASRFRAGIRSRRKLAAEGKWLERGGVDSRSNPTEVVPRSSVRNSWGRKLQNWHRRRYVETDNRRCLTQWEATGLTVSLYTAV